MKIPRSLVWMGGWTLVSSVGGKESLGGHELKLKEKSSAMQSYQIYQRGVVLSFYYLLPWGRTQASSFKVSPQGETETERIEGLI